MKSLLLLPLTLVACSIDWGLARTPASGDSGAPPDLVPGAGAGGDAPITESALVLCDEIVALESEPLVDGELEANLALHPWLHDPAAEAPPGVRVSVTLAHRPGGLYFFADVEDPTRDPAPQDALAYCGDGLELFVDDDGMIQNPPGFDVPGTMQLIIAAPGDDGAPARRGQRFFFPGTSSDSTDLGAWASGDFLALPTARGYAIEAFVVASDLDLDSWSLATGGKIGWNMSLNIGGPQDPGIDACTTRSQQLHFRLASAGSCTAPYCNASALCAPTLAAVP